MRRTLTLFLFAALFTIRLPAGWSEGQIHRIYYESGAIKGEFPMKKGRLNGTTRWYYESGAVGALMDYRENRLHGTTRIFYENGNTKKIVQWRDNTADGTSRYFSPDGQLIALERHSKGDLQVRWVFDGQGEALFCEEPGGENR